MGKKTRLHGSTARLLRAGVNHFEAGVNQRSRAKWLSMRDPEKCVHEWTRVSSILVLCEKCGTIKYD